MKAKNAGFTIIEVLIVLAIAGLIMAIVLKALPTLQRNSRNNQRRQDVSTILGAISNYELNHSGNFTSSSSNGCGSGTNPSCFATDQPLGFVKSKLTYYYGDNQVIITPLDAKASASPNPNTDVDKVYVFNHQKCSSSQGSSTPDGAGYNDVVALYAIEAGSNGQTGSQCTEL